MVVVVVVWRQAGRGSRQVGLMMAGDGRRWVSMQRVSVAGSERGEGAISYLAASPGHDALGRAPSHCIHIHCIHGIH